jgi:cytoskeletal protein CcmA (bactofilin family)
VRKFEEEPTMADATTGWRRVVLGGAPEAEVPASPPERPEMTTIDPGCEIEGKLSLDRSICIEGEFRGSIHCAETVTIGEAAAVQADIEARTVEIRGAVVGNVKASREVVIFKGGRLHGDIDAPSLVMERGAFYQGQTRMYRPEAGLRAPMEATSLEV